MENILSDPSWVWFGVIVTLALIVAFMRGGRGYMPVGYMPVGSEWGCRQSHPDDCYLHGPFLLSHPRITVSTWKKAMEKNWSKVAKPDARILVLSGTHGGADGSLEPNYKEDNFYQQDLGVKSWLKTTEPYKSGMSNN